MARRGVPMRYVLMREFNLTKTELEALPNSEVEGMAAMIRLENERKAR